jgi:hypothetical protein
MSVAAANRPRTVDLRINLRPEKALIDTVAAKNLFIISPSLQRFLTIGNLEPRYLDLEFIGIQIDSKEYVAERLSH